MFNTAIGSFQWLHNSLNSIVCLPTAPVRTITTLLKAVDQWERKSFFSFMSGASSFTFLSLSTLMSLKLCTCWSMCILLLVCFTFKSRYLKHLFLCLLIRKASFNCVCTAIYKVSQLSNNHTNQCVQLIKPQKQWFIIHSQLVKPLPYKKVKVISYECYQRLVDATIKTCLNVCLLQVGLSVVHVKIFCFIL